MNQYENQPWFKPLKDEVEKTSLNKTAKKIGTSPRYVNDVMQGYDFPGRLDRFIDKIEGALMNQTVMCPILDEITKDRCQENQSRPWSNTNSSRVRLFRACRNGCPHSKLEPQS